MKSRPRGAAGEASQEDIDSREWISLREMQEILGIGSTKAYELASSGSIPGVIRIGRIIRINRQELEGWLKQQAAVRGRE